MSRESDVDRRISVAERGQWRVASLLLGMPLAAARTPPQVWIANTDGGRRIAGSAALWVGRRHGHFSLKVIRPERRQGVGAALFEAVLRRSRAARLDSLFPLEMVAEGSGSDAFLESQGFEVQQRLFRFETSVQTCLELFEPFYRRVVGRGRIPDDAQMIGLGEAEQHGLSSQAARLVARFLGGRREQALRRLRGETDHPYDRDASCLLVQAGELMGLALSRYLAEQQAWLGDATVVRPDCRGGWANAWLKYEWPRRMKDAGRGERVFFDAGGAYRDTMKQVERLKAATIEERLMYRRRLSFTPPKRRQDSGTSGGLRTD